MKKTATAIRKRVIEIDHEKEIDAAARRPASMALIPAGQHLPERVAQAMHDLALIEAAPMRDRILVCRADPKKEINGIIIPDIAQETQGVGIVVSVGSGHYLGGQDVPLDVKQGDVVFFNKYAGTETQVGPHKLLRLREEEIEFRANGQKCMALAVASRKVKDGRANSR